MGEILSDAEIVTLISEPKIIPRGLIRTMRVTKKRKHTEFDHHVTGERGSRFILKLRQNTIDAFDFSAILLYVPAKGGHEFRLRRYNGRHGEHTNKLENQTFYEYHIHTATQRYQECGIREDGYAEVTDRYVDLQSATMCLLKDCGFRHPDGPISDLMEWGITYDG